MTIQDERTGPTVREYQRWRAQHSSMPVRQADRDRTEYAWAMRRLGYHQPEIADILGISLIQLERVLAGGRA